MEKVEDKTNFHLVLLEVSLSLGLTITHCASQQTNQVIAMQPQFTCVKHLFYTTNTPIFTVTVTILLGH